MTNEPVPTYEQLKQRLDNAEGALQALRAGQVDTIASEQGNLVVRLAEAEAQSKHIKQVLLAIRNVNQLIVTEDDPLRLIEKACANLTESMGYLNAWIALLDPWAKTVNSTASSGFDGGFVWLNERLKEGDFIRCMKRSLECDEIIVVKDPRTECMDCPLSSEYGGRAGLSRSLNHGGRIYGILTVSVPADYASNEEEQVLFSELANDLAFALHRIEAEKLSRQRQLMLARTESIAHIGSWEWEIADDRVRWSEELFRIFHRDPELGAPSFAEHSDLYVPEDMQRLQQAVEQCVAEGTSYRLELRAKRKDGEIRHCVARGLAEVDSYGKTCRLFGSLQDITERKLSELVIATQQRELELTLDATTDGIWFWSFLNNELRFSPGYYAMLGYEANEFPADFENWKSRIHPDDLDKVLWVATEYLKTKPDVYHNEFRMRTKKGDYRWIAVHAKVVEHDEQGDALRMIGSHQDITDRKQAEDAMRESEEKYRLFVETSKEGVWSMNVDHVTTYVNQAMADMLGYETHEMLGRRVEEYFFPEDKAFHEQRMKLRHAGVDETYERRFRRKDGSLLWTMVSAKVVNDDKGCFAGSFAMFTDITDRKHAEETSAENRAKLEAALASMNDAVFISDTQGQLIEFNDAFATFHRFRSKDECARTFAEYSDILDVFMADGTLVPVEMWVVPRALRGESATNAEYSLRRKDTGETWVGSYSFAPIRDKAGLIVGSVVVGRDITDLKRSENERDKLEAQLRQSQKMESVGRLAGGVAHDFNNMLGVILGHAELAMDYVSTSEPIYEDLMEIFNAARRSADITRQLLAFARKQTIAPVVIDLNETIEGMLKMLRRLIGEDIDLAWLPETAMWPVKMDPSQIDQILANLCVNARDAIDGVGKLTIETGTAIFDEAVCMTHAEYVPGDFVLLAVSDNGCGMDSQTLDNLFEPFFTTKGLGKGTGLGLATVYGIVKQNQGFINVYSELGEGTTFRIYIPAHKESKTKALPEKILPIPRSREGETILLVEDEPTILKMTTTMLERMGYTVLPANTPGQAINLAREYKGDIHLLMTDVVMPGMNGRDLADNLLSVYPNIKRLFMSGYTANVIAHHGILDEGVQFIQKPFSKKNLAIKIRLALDQDRFEGLP